MKHFRLFALCLALGLVLAACGVTPNPSQGTTEPPVSTQTPPSTTVPDPDVTTAPSTAQGEMTLSDLISDHTNESMEWVSGTGEYTNKESARFRLPQIAPISQDAIDCQQEILDAFLPSLDEIRKSADEKFSTPFTAIDYEAYYNSGILSVLIYKDYGIDYIEYHTYNINTETGARLDTDALLAHLSLTQEAYLEAVAQAAQAFYEEKYVGFQEHDQAFYQTQLNNTISDANISAALPYLNENGKLAVVIDVYSPAGADSYPEIIELPL